MKILADGLLLLIGEAGECLLVVCVPVDMAKSSLIPADVFRYQIVVIGRGQGCVTKLTWDVGCYFFVIDEQGSTVSRLRITRRCLGS